MDEKQILLNLHALTKAYGTVPVLTGIDLTLTRGRILGLIGENGAGKSTLARCIAGLQPITSGTLEFPQPGTRVYTIPQEFNLIPTLTVYDNIFLGREQTRFGILDRKSMIRKSAELLARLHSTVRPEQYVEELSVAEKQMVEIAKAFLLDSNLLIMDEPTTVLNHQETDVLFDIMRHFITSGNSIIYISHKLEEVRTICDEIAVLRDGVLVAHEDAKALSAIELAERMVGRELGHLEKPVVTMQPDAPVVLEVENLCSGKAVNDVSFSLRKGEILGVAGLAGAGRTELAETICALRRKTGGTIRLNGEIVHFSSPADAMKHGLSYLSEDRQGTAVLLDFTVQQNTTLASLGEYCTFGFLKRNKERSAVLDYIRKFQIKTESPETRLRNLSGGNQQKVAIAKGLDTHPHLFIFDEPTRGVDVAARSEIYHFIKQLALSGVTCILISSDLEEIIRNCLRVMVMRNGSVSGELRDREITEETIMFLATGVKTK